MLKPRLVNLCTRRAVLVSALLFLPAANPAWAATTVAEPETTAQQAVLRITTDQPASAACTIRLSVANQSVANQSAASPNPSNLFGDAYQPAHDVNPSLFKSSDQCSRPGNIRDANTLTIVLGKRTAEIAADHLRYSRSLQAATTYAYQIQIGADIVKGEFTTATILPGNTYNDSRVDPAHPGEYLYPSIDWADKNKTYIDPFTGALLKRGGSPGDIGAAVMEEPIGEMRPLGSSWKVTGKSAAYTGISQGKLFLPAQSWKPPANDIRTVDFVQLRVKLSGTASAAAACLTLDGAQCAGGVIQQAVTANDRRITFGTNVPVLRAWQNGPTPPAYRDDVRVHQGAAVVADAGGGVKNVTWASGDYFSIHWAPGSRIKMGAPNGDSLADCEIASVTSDKQITIVAKSCNAPTGVASFSGSNFGFLLWTPNSAENTLNVSEPAWTLGISGFPSELAAGYTNLCSPLPAAGPGRVEGSLCGTGPGYAQYQIATPIYWFGPDGQSVLLGPTTVGRGPLSNGYCSSNGVIWDGNEPATYYCTSGQPKAPSVIMAVRYKGNYQPALLTDSAELRADVTFLNTNIDQAAAAFDPAYRGFAEGAQYGWNLLEWQPYGKKGALLLKRNIDSQNSPGWWMAFDLNTNSVLSMLCSYCGGAGSVNRWMGIHSTSGAYGIPWAITTVATLQYGSQVMPATNTNNTNTSTNTNTNAKPEVPLPAAPYRPCPADSFDPAIAGKPVCSAPLAIPSLTPTDRNNRNLYRQTWQPGDYAEVWDGDRDSYERVRLMKIDSANGQVKLVVQRCVRSYMFTNCGAHSSNLRLVAAPGAFVEFWWNWSAGRNAVSAIEDPHSSGCHYVYAFEMFVVGCQKVHPRGAFAGGQERELPGVPVRLGAVPASFNSAPVLVNVDAPFAGHAHELNGNYNEMHPSLSQYRFPEKDMLLALRPYLGDPDSAKNARKIGQYIYKIPFDPAARLDYRKLPLIMMAGDMPLADVSPAVLKDVREDWYKACYVVIAGNCYAGSQPGEIYLNAPFVSQTSPYQNRFDYNPPVDLTVTQSSSASTMQQIRVTDHNDLEGHFVRRITTALAPARDQGVYWNAHALPDNSWAFFLGYRMDRVRNELMLVKLPPMPVRTDPAKRNGFQAVPVNVPAHADAANVRAVFGYAENGNPEALFCTSRQVVCTTGVSPTGKNAKPFVWLDEPQTPLPCRTGCKLTIPALPGHVVYYKLEWLNASAQVVASGPLSAAAVP